MAYNTQELYDNIRRVPLLTHREEIELAKRIETGDTDAKARMVEANLSLVAHIAERYGDRDSSRDLPFDDLVSEGTVGLMNAVEKFDYRRGFRFSTYAVDQIRAAMQRAGQNKGRMIRLPVNKEERFDKILRVREELTVGGNAPDSEAIAEVLGIAPDDVDELLGAAESPRSLNRQIVDNDDEPAEVGDLLPDRNSEDELDALLDRAYVRERFELLNDRQREVIELRYGFRDDGDLTQQEVGEAIGVSRHTVRDIETKAMETMRGG